MKLVQKIWQAINGKLLLCLRVWWRPLEAQLKHEHHIYQKKSIGEDVSKMLLLGVKETKVWKYTWYTAPEHSSLFLGYLINFKHFHELYESNNPPKCSAREMDQAEDEKEDEEAVFSLGQSGSLEQEKFNFIKFLALRNHFYSAHTSFNSPHKKFSC